MGSGDPFLPERDGPAEERASYPLGFKITVVLTVLYLLYRLGQGVLWLISAMFG